MENAEARCAMAEYKMPRQRNKHITGSGLGVRKGTRTGGSSVGGGQSGFSNPGSSRTNGNKSGGNKIPILALILAILVGGGGLLSTRRFSADSGQSAGQDGQAAVQSFGNRTGSGPLSALAGMLFPSSGWSAAPNTGVLNDAVSPAAREKFTVLRGGGEDTATVMVYLCGTDLESRRGMATADLNEMLDALSSPQVHLIVCAGGCAQWQNETFSDGVNQLWQVRDGQLVPIEVDASSPPAAVTAPDAAMTDPDTLSAFLAWCAGAYPADRNILILWDHGGGSLSGYGYDENHPGAGSLSLADLDQALSGAGVKFDFVGFDACLMAATEAALLLSRYADYLIASEETEPAGGWYYTGWLTDLAKNPSRPTLELGQRIADDFVDTSAKAYRGQSATMSVTDLAELGETLEGNLEDFAREARAMMEESGTRRLSAARTEARDFPASVDQIDLVHFARNLGTEAGNALAETLLGAVKYNRTANAANTSGLSAYFPWKDAERAEGAALALERLGLGGEYARCVREFAALETAGRYASGASASPADALSERAAAAASGAEAGGPPQTVSQIAALLGRLLGVNMTDGGAAVQDGANPEARRLEAMAEDLADHRFDPAWLVWKDGKLSLTQEQLSLVRGLDVNLFFDDGEGYVELGVDNSCRIDEDGALIGGFDGAWVSINGQPVAYYHLASVEEEGRFVDTGRVPVTLNGEPADLILLFTDEQPDGYIAGARPMYENGETETVFRGLTELEPGDELVFLCDYYLYDKTFEGRYTLGDPMTVTENMEVSYTDVGSSTRALYRFTDVYGGYWWTEPGT